MIIDLSLRYEETRNRKISSTQIMNFLVEWGKISIVLCLPCIRLLYRKNHVIFFIFLRTKENTSPIFYFRDNMSYVSETRTETLTKTLYYLLDMFWMMILFSFLSTWSFVNLSYSIVALPLEIKKKKKRRNCLCSVMKLRRLTYFQFPTPMSFLYHSNKLKHGYFFLWICFQCHLLKIKKKKKNST